MKLEATESMILGSAYGFRLQEELLRCRLWALFGIRVDANLAHGHCDRSIVMGRHETKTEQTRNKRIWETKHRYKRFHTKTRCKNCTAWIASFGHVDVPENLACIAVSTFSGTCREISGFGSPAAATTGPNASTAICAQKVHTVPTCSNLVPTRLQPAEWYRIHSNRVARWIATKEEVAQDLGQRRPLDLRRVVMLRSTDPSIRPSWPSVTDVVLFVWPGRLGFGELSSCENLPAFHDSCDSMSCDVSKLSPCEGCSKMWHFVVI